MEERNMQLDDDGKIKMKKNREDFLEQTDEGGDPDEIVLDVPDFAGFREEDDGVGVSGDELAAKNELYEQYLAQKKVEGEELFRQAEELFAQNDLEGAGEKYLDSVAAYNGNWRAWFGVVRVQTKDLTDFSGVYECQNAYNRALKRAGRAGKEELFATYSERLTRKIEENSAQAEVLERADENYRSSKREPLTAAFAKSKRPLIVAAACFLVLLIAGVVLTGMINTVSGIQILIPAIAVDVLAAAALVLALIFTRKFLAARYAFRKNESNLSTKEGRQAAELRSENELVQSILDDFKG